MTGKRARVTCGTAACLTALVLLASPVHAQAVLIDFESLACAGPGAQTFGAPYLSNGFAFASSVPGPNTFANWCTGNSNYAGSTASSRTTPAPRRP